MLSIKLSENEGRAPEAVPYMPPGEQEICATVDGKPGRRTVTVDEAACHALQADLEEKLRAASAGEKARPVLLYDHKAGEAAAVPLGFEWDEQRGILLRVEWTQAGRDAVEGGNYGYVSPAFRLREGGVIAGLAPGVEVGSLVNDPAFERNECIAASREPIEETVVVHTANPHGCNQYKHKCGNPMKKTEEETESEPKEDDTPFTSASGDFVRIFVAPDGSTTQAPENENDWSNISTKLFRTVDGKFNVTYIDKNSPIGAGGGEYDSLTEAVKHIPFKMTDTTRKKILEYFKKYRKGTDAMLGFTVDDGKTTKASKADLPPPAELEKMSVGAHNKPARNEAGTTKKHKKMDRLKNMLGLDAEADDEEVEAAIAELQEDDARRKKRLEEVEAECEQHEARLKQYKQKNADAFAKRLTDSGVIAPRDNERLEAARSLYMDDPDRAELIFSGMRQAGFVPAEGERITASRAEAQQHSHMSIEDLLDAGY